MCRSWNRHTTCNTAATFASLEVSGCGPAVPQMCWVVSHVNALMPCGLLCSLSSCHRMSGPAVLFHVWFELFWVVKFPLSYLISVNLLFKIISDQCVWSLMVVKAHKNNYLFALCFHFESCKPLNWITCLGLIESNYLKWNNWCCHSFLCACEKHFKITQRNKSVATKGWRAAGRAFLITSCSKYCSYTNKMNLYHPNPR